MSKKVTLLGSTGSIGTQSLDVIRAEGFEVSGLAAHTQTDLLLRQVEDFHPAMVAVTDERAADKVQAAFANMVHAPRLLRGAEGLRTLAAQSGADVVLNAVVGAAGLPATLAALESGKAAAYATDFPDDSMIGVEGIVAIPHLGASTPESEDNCAMMAVDQMKDYLENGNILNSVNMPSISMAREPGTRRICIIHKNVPNTIALFAATCGDAGINIENMQSKSRGEYAYTILDVSGELSPAAVDTLRALEPIVKVRVIE